MHAFSKEKKWLIFQSQPSADDNADSSSGAGASTRSSAATSGATPTNPKKHILCVNTFQMCILLLFNRRYALLHHALLGAFGQQSIQTRNR